MRPCEINVNTIVDRLVLQKAQFAVSIVNERPMIGGPSRVRFMSETFATIIEILVYIAMGAVVIVLVLGVGSMSGGSRGPKAVARSNKLMRWRVGIQFVAIALLAILVFVIKRP